jgi:hypothetical protein
VVGTCGRFARNALEDVAIIIKIDSKSGDVFIVLARAGCDFGLKSF